MEINKKYMLVNNGKEIGYFLNDIYHEQGTNSGHPRANVDENGYVYSIGSDEPAGKIDGQSYIRLCDNFEMNIIKSS